MRLLTAGLLVRVQPEELGKKKALLHSAKGLFNYLFKANDPAAADGVPGLDPHRQLFPDD